MRWHLRRRTPGLTCQEMVELVTDYVEGALSPQLRERFEAHLQACDGCTAYVEQMTRTIEATNELPEKSITDAAMDELLRAFRDWNRPGDSS